MTMITREHAWELVNARCDFALKRHLAHVAAAMEVMAKHLGHGEEAEKWYLTGLLHDIDWNETISNPEKHCGPETLSLLREHGADEAMCRAIQSHYDFWNVPRESDREKALFAVDEISGFTVAVALMRPTKMIGITPKSVTKKMKDKAFAAAVSREDMASCKEYFQMEVSDLLNILIPAFEHIAGEWELVGDN